MLDTLELKNEISWEWMILLIAKTGLRFSEALALTPADFNFSRQSISVSKTWDYKGEGGFYQLKINRLLEKYKLIGKRLFNFLN